jgi:membrane protease YdiL (CAAX protease family)
MLISRVLHHLYQGPLGAVWVLGFGLVMSLYYRRTRKLFNVVFAHALADIVPCSVTTSISCTVNRSTTKAHAQR